MEVKNKEKLENDYRVYLLKRLCVSLEEAIDSEPELSFEKYLEVERR
jgi:hypothetical protein